jgi:16S rRNA (guanine1207-N2)-methyltransferase
MAPNAIHTLFSLLAEQAYRMDSAREILFMRARFHSSLHSLKGKFRCIQTFKPYAEELKEAGLEVVQLPSAEKKVPLCLYLPTDQKEENLSNFALCMQWLEDGGHLFCSMENALGASRFEKELGRLAGNVETYSKNKCRVFWVTKSNTLDQELMRDWLSKGTVRTLEGTDLLTRPGIFGWNKIDRGSALLSESLPSELQGSGADVGAGYGYLSHFILKYAKGVQKLLVYEAEGLALDMARLNLERIRGGTELSFYWHDVRRGLEAQDLDWIVMNPPFHEEGESDVELGKQFIRVASQALRPEGELYLVANARLPYEQVLKESFRWVECSVQKSGFKVFKARK